MKWTIKTRLIGCLVALGVGLVAIGGSSWMSATTAGGQIKSIIADRVVPLQQLKIASDMYAVNIVDTVHKTRSGAFDTREALASVAQAREAIEQNWSAYTATRMTPEEETLVARVTADLPAADAAVVRLETILRAGDIAALEAFADQELYDAIDPVTASIGALVDLQIRVAREDGLAAQKAFDISMMVMGGIGLIALGIMAFTTRFVLVGVTGPLQSMTSAMRRLAGGDHATEVPAVGRRDELGEMADAVIVFRDAAIAKIKADAELVETKARADREQKATSEAAIREQQTLVVQSFGVALSRLAEGELTYRLDCDLPPEYVQLRDDFNTAMESLQEAISVVVSNVSAIRSGAGEISQAADDLSRRTEQQAASLEETAAALDEITA
ncbi:methyl-accepting chemotaxis protein, partial [Brevundimonas sp.]|uniref:methyl-accepting chemotaxis protein n=1 Tax=Brevundimonas sp. TaxID=1871086 RepID=UPI002D325FC3